MNFKLTPAGWARLLLYAVSALAGIVAVVANTLGYSDLSVLLGTLAGAGAAITGGTAAVNLPKAPDQAAAGGLNIAAIGPALLEIAEAAKMYQAAMTYAPKHAAEEAPQLPVYDGPTTGGE